MGSTFSASAPSAFSILENLDLSNMLLNFKDNGTHLAYFDPAEGAVPNLGVGVSGDGVSDHKYFGGNSREEY